MRASDELGTGGLLAELFANAPIAIGVRLLVSRAKGTIEALEREGGGLRMRVALPTAQ